MNDKLPALMPLFPRKIVMILNPANDLGPKQLRHEPVNHRMIGRCILAHQVHRSPIFLSGLAVET